MVFVFSLVERRVGARWRGRWASSLDVVDGPRLVARRVAAPASLVVAGRDERCLSAPAVGAPGRETRRTDGCRLILSLVDSAGACGGYATPCPGARHPVVQAGDTHVLSSRRQKLLPIF